MMKRLATAFALALGLVVLVPGSAQADGYSPSGAYVATNLICMPLWGGYSVYPSGPDFQWVTAYDTQSLTYSAWMSQQEMRLHGFAKKQNPSNPNVMVYVVYARWMGNDWEMVGDWGKVMNANGTASGRSYC